MNFSDEPDLTAYAMGELDAAATTRVCQWLAEYPEAREELARIQQTLDVLQEAPSFPRRALHPRQRETVLAMAAATSGRNAVIPFATPQRPISRPGWTVAKYAAAASLAVGAFVLGQKTVERPPLGVEQPGLQAASPAGSIPAPEPTLVVSDAAATGFVAVEKANAPLPPAPSESPSSPAQPQIVQAGPPRRVNAVVDAAVTVSDARATASLPVVKNPAPSAPVVAHVPPQPPSLETFIIAHRDPQAMVSIQPKLLRPARLPVPEEFAGVKLASPMAPNAKPGPEVSRKPDPQPALSIHSWKTEIASCPWAPERRLLRVVTQIPVEQSGIAINEAAYQINLKFDPFQVQGYRLVAEKHLAASPGGNFATRFAWYEIVPTRNFAASPSRPITVGTVDVVQPRSASPNTNAPATLQRIVDRGLAWEDSREDFVFETAMIGFSLLLQGTENVGRLNHKLVLELAESTKGEDPKGERAKFIQAIRQAQRVAGL